MYLLIKDNENDIIYLISPNHNYEEIAYDCGLIEIVEEFIWYEEYDECNAKIYNFSRYLHLSDLGNLKDIIALNLNNYQIDNCSIKEKKLSYIELESKYFKLKKELEKIKETL